MKRNYTAITLLILISAVRLVGQTNCNHNLLVGTWTHKCAVHDSDNLNVDSLLRESRQFDSTITLTLTFSEDNKCLLQSSTNKHKSKYSYSFDPIECKIIFGKKSKASEVTTNKIKYLDNKNLILCHENPKGAKVCRIYYK